jgi:hypothetical protein
MEILEISGLSASITSKSGKVQAITSYMEIFEISGLSASITSKSGEVQAITLRKVW